MSKKAGWTRSSISGALEQIGGASSSSPPRLFSRKLSKGAPFIINDKNCSNDTSSKSSYLTPNGPRRPAAHDAHSRTPSTSTSIPGITATSNLIGLGIYRSPKTSTGLTIRSSSRARRLASILAFILIVLLWRYSNSPKATSISSNLSSNNYLPSPPSGALLEGRAPFPLKRLFGAFTSGSASSSSSSSSNRAQQEQAESLLASSPNGGHTFHPNGLLLVNPKGRHPIHVLIDHAEKKWRDLVKKQSDNIDDATAEYKRRYKRNPPAGWEGW